MKKLLSVVLSVIMAMSVVIIPATVSAKETKKTPNTYVSAFELNETKVEGIYIPNKGTVNRYYTPYKTYLRFTKTNGKVITLDKCTRGDEGKDKNIYEYYIRGDRVYYCFMNERKNDYLYQIKSVDLNGKNKKTICSIPSTKRYFTLIGGYGSGVIFVEEGYEENKSAVGYTVKMFKNKKVTKLFKYYLNYMEKSDNIEPKVFAGKIFYKNKVYNLATGKTTKFVVKERHVTKNYMYYINKNKNLKSMDKNGTIRLVATDVYKYYVANNSKSVLYSKLDSDKNEVYYQRTGTDNEVRLCTKKDIRNLVGKSDDTVFEVISPLFYKNNIYFITNEGKRYPNSGFFHEFHHAYIVTVGVNDGNPKVYYEAPYGYDIDTWIFNYNFNYKTIEY